MALTFYSQIEADEVARQLSNDHEDMIETLAALAMIFADADDADAFAAEVARQHNGSIAHQAVLPFLQVLTDHLQAVEADDPLLPGAK